MRRPPPILVKDLDKSLVVGEQTKLPPSVEGCYIFLVHKKYDHDLPSLKRWAVNKGLSVDHISIKFKVERSLSCGDSIINVDRDKLLGEITKEFGDVDNPEVVPPVLVGSRLLRFGVFHSQGKRKL